VDIHQRYAPVLNHLDADISAMLFIEKRQLLMHMSQILRIEKAEHSNRESKQTSNKKK
jgi:hypothetical protein